jgi:predicted DNA-binding protein (MmcQ/YjbR family)
MGTQRSAMRRFLGTLPGAVEEEPFGPGVWVWKVGGRMVALLNQTGEPPSLSLKCDPVRALDLRAAFPAITAGYHLNKEHWNSLALDGSLPAALVEELARHSHDLVCAGLPKAQRQRIQLLASQGDHP